MAASSTSVVCQRPLATRSAARQQVVVCCAARPQQAQKQNKLAQMAVAGLAAAVLSCGGAIAAEGAPGQGPMKSKICASNPTAKICLKDSVPRTQSAP
ncbi:hypothetical protein WJX84_003378 [Apatococcus fuscideae]|uniref:Uncharacterized protein n=1 Tax=Apatococcus fuscideae TaxID=2026836 RepID=A0AAW1S745_9CHLO